MQDKLAVDDMDYFVAFGEQPPVIRGVDSPDYDALRNIDEKVTGE